MKSFVRRPLVVSIASVLSLALLAPVANAQETGSKSMREQREERMRELGKGKQQDAKGEKKPSQYPNATRTSPEAQASGKMVKYLQALQDSYDKQDMAAVLAKADEIGAMPAANAYEKSLAYSMAGNAASDLDQQEKAADYFRKAVDANGLENDSHYATMYNLAVIQFGLERYPDALATMDRFLAETKSDKTEHLSFRAGILSSMGRNDEAAAAYKDLVAKNPGDKRLLMNAVASLQGAEKTEQANALLEDAYKRGMLTEGRELRSLYVGYMNASRWADAQKVIEDGVAKGVLQPGPDLARDYQVLAQTAYSDDKLPLAIELYTKAAPMAADGEAYLNLAKVLDYAGKKADAKAAAQKALDKGVKKPDDARKILAR